MTPNVCPPGVSETVAALAFGAALGMALLGFVVLMLVRAPDEEDE